MDGVVGMVLAAGLGTRLRPLTALVPKPVVPVAGLPLVQYALARLRKAGARRAVVNAHHLAGGMGVVARRAAAAVGISLGVSAEPVIAGTGGALREARRLLEGAEVIVLWNGDVLFDVDLAGVVASHRASSALSTMVLAPMPPGATYATVDVDPGMAVRRIAGHGPGGEGLVPLHFTGVHVLSAVLLDHVPGEPFACDVNRHVYPPLLAAGRVRAVVAAGYWNDLGTPARYLQANQDVLSGAAAVALPDADPLAGLREMAPGIHAGPAVAVDPAAVVEGPVLLGEGSAVEAGARIGPGVVLGRGCRVGRGASLRRVVAWEGTVIRPGEVLADAVAAGDLRVPAGS